MPVRYLCRFIACLIIFASPFRLAKLLLILVAALRSRQRHWHRRHARNRRQTTSHASTGRRLLIVAHALRERVVLPQHRVLIIVLLADVVALEQLLKVVIDILRIRILEIIEADDLLPTLVASSSAIMSAICGIKVLEAVTMIDEVRGSGTAITRPSFLARSLLLAVGVGLPPPRPPRKKNGVMPPWLPVLEVVGSGNNWASWSAVSDGPH